MVSIFSLIQKLKFRFVAKNRHDIHSPFVYNFIENIINSKTISPKTNLPKVGEKSNLTQWQEWIIGKIQNYYKLTNLCCSINDEPANLGPTLWLFDILPSHFEPKSCFDIAIVLNPYATKSSLSRWEKAVENELVTLSLDLFNLGIILFRKDFLIKQHFKLRY